ncbi:MAG TPA: histidine kinase, partial [Candidatus Blautia stercoravium]|nr:histidine kinase [Candidatus Blautia stercoravium]
RDVPIRIVVKEGEEAFYQYKNTAFQEPARYIKTETFGIPNWEIRYEIAESYCESYAMINLVPSISILILVLLLTWILICYFHKRLSKDLSLLLREVEEAQGGNLDVKIQDSEIVEIQRLSDSIETFLKKIKMLIREVYNKEIERQNLELNLLQAKMNPHFLYNNLSAINWIALDAGNRKISKITTELAAFYRTALNKGKNIDKLSVELANIKAYINLQLISHENSFEVEYQVEETLLNYDVPIFVLQPLVENAIEHGIDQLRNEKGKIRISIRKKEDKILFTVHDNGTQLYDKIGENVLDEKKYGYGTGNVHKRIQLLYGEKSGLRLWADSTGTTAEIHIFYKALRHAEVI